MGNIDLIWFTVYPAAFKNKGPNPPALESNDYEWLDEKLSKSDNVILLWHVPIRTNETKKYGAWPGNRNLTIPLSDRLYKIIDPHLEKISAIFNGHIHKPIKSEYKGVPVFLCPAFKTGCHCRLNQSEKLISIKPVNCGIDGAKLSF